MSNKRKGKLGVYLLKISAINPLENVKDLHKKEKQYFLNYSDKLDIGDVNMAILQDKGADAIIISFKNIYINMYNVFLIDNKTGFISYRHESFCLWEQNVFSFFNNETNDLVTL